MVGYQDFAERLQKQGKVSLEEELLPVLSGESAFVIQPPTELRGGESEGEGGTGQGDEEATTPELPGLEGEAPGAPPAEEVAPAPLDPEGVVAATGIPYLTFIGTQVDTDATTEALAKLQAPLAQAFAAGASGQAPTFEQGEIDGIPINSASISPAVDLTYAIIDDTLVVATQPDGIARLAAGPGGLNEAPPFEQSTAGFPEEPALLLYLNLRELIALAEGAGLASDPAYSLLSGEIGQLPSAALAVERGETELDTQLRVSLAQPQE